MARSIKSIVESGGPSAQFATIGPAEAKYLLGLNTKNRKLSAATVKRLSRTMAGGRWVDGVANVAVASDGAISNGQHTLSAIVESGTTVGVTLTVGIDPDSRAVFDTGNRRNLSGTLDIMGKQNTVNLAAGAQLARRYEEQAAAGKPLSSLTSRTINYDPLEMVEWIEAIGDDTTQSAVHMSKATYQALGANLKPSAVTAFYILALRADPEGAETMHESLLHGVGLFPGNPYLALRNWATNLERKNDQAGRQLATMAKAWSKHRAGLEMRMANIRTNETLSVVE